MGAVIGSRTAAGGSGPSVTLNDSLFAVARAGGSDGNLYASIHNGGPPGPADSLVFKISTSTGKILQKIQFPNGSNPDGLVSCVDGNLWIAEPGTNQIARMTTAGALKQFSLPTPNAQPQQITVGNDGALWFTEQGSIRFRHRMRDPSALPAASEAAPQRTARSGLPKAARGRSAN